MRSKFQNLIRSLNASLFRDYLFSEVVLLVVGLGTAGASISIILIVRGRKEANP